ncbi:hypothetical protein KY285_019417 [Solanum tuberosum]|nr:hypothetical protein KY285_019417 [Solanum tuberosum]
MEMETPGFCTENEGEKRVTGLGFSGLGSAFWVLDFGLLEILGFFVLRKKKKKTQGSGSVCCTYVVCVLYIWIVEK